MGNKLEKNAMKKPPIELILDDKESLELIESIGRINNAIDAITDTFVKLSFLLSGNVLSQYDPVNYLEDLKLSRQLNGVLSGSSSIDEFVEFLQNRRSKLGSEQNEK